MNEVQRQAALEAMGIDSWFPRYVLPGAAPSRPCEWPEALPVRAGRQPEIAAAVAPPSAAPDPERARPVVPRQVPEVPPLRESLAAELGETRRKPSPPAPTAAPVARVEESGNTGAPVRFHLAFLRCGPIAVLNQLPYLGRESLGAAPRQLFLSLAQALGWPAQLVEPREESFRWPFAASMTMDADANAARLALRAYVEQMAGEQPFRALLVMGGQLAPFVLPADWQGEAETGRLLRAPELPWPVLLSRSLDEVLSVPALKRQVWRDLAPLAGFAIDA